MTSDYNKAVEIIKSAVLESQYRAAKGANAIQLSLYFGIGKFVSENTRAGVWGTGAVENISQKLSSELPGLRGFSSRNLKNMRMFYESWKDIEINSATAAAELTEEKVYYNLLLSDKSAAEAADLNINEFLSIGFTHHIEILTKAKNAEERMFYIHQTYINGWNKYILRDMLKADVYRHQGLLPNNFSNAISNSQNALKAVGMFKDEYLLDFINVEELDVSDIQDIDERVIENEIVKNIKNFILCLGSSFCFIGNQHRITVGDEEFFIDLLFYNRDLQCLVAIELKKGKFKPSYLGQLNFYLSALDDNEKREGENPSIGLLLCRDMDKTVVELAVRDYNNPMGVATYSMPNDVPEKYKSLRPIMQKAKELLEKTGDDIYE